MAYLDAIEQAFRRILSFPKAGAPHPTVQPRVRSLARQRYRNFYAFEGETILIVRILHVPMDVAAFVGGGSRGGFDWFHAKTQRHEGGTPYSDVARHLQVISVTQNSVMNLPLRSRFC